jgi:ABC-type Fe3+-hydroxamate transport system substrate-binding protein
MRVFRLTKFFGLWTAIALLSVYGVALAAPVSMTDQYGRKVELEKPAERIVTVPNPAASLGVLMTTHAPHHALHIATHVLAMERGGRCLYGPRRTG